MDLNFAHAIVNRAAEAPERPALLFPGGGITRAQFAETLLRFAGVFKDLGIGRQSRLMIHSQQSRPEVLLVQLAAALLGASWTVLRPTLSIRSAQATHFVHIDGPVSDLPGHTTIRIDGTFMARTETRLPALAEFPGFSGPDALVTIGGSSGTTGVPKLIPYTVARLVSGRPNDLWDSVRVGNSQFPLTAVLGFANAMALLSKGQVVAMADTYHDLAALGVDTVSGSPAQIDRLIARSAAPAADNRLKTVRAAGSLVSVAALRRWLGYFETIAIGYGSSEGGGGGGMTITEAPDDLVLRYTMRDGVEFQVVDESDRELPPGVPGIFRLRTRHTIKGYLGDAAATAEAFRDGWFYPGDVAVIGPDRRVQIVGRVKDQLNFGGVKANAADIDQAVAQVPGIAAVVAFDMTDANGAVHPAVLAVITPGISPEEVADKARQRCALVLRQAAERLRVYVTEALPLTETGKPVRRAARDLARDLRAY